MFLVILIPCMNEEKSIQEVISKIPPSFDFISKFEILVIDDGSTDRTAELAEKAGAKVISHPYNMGVGVAFNTGIEKAIDMGSDIVVNMDGDGQFDPGDIPKLIEPIVHNKADFVTASRFKNQQLEPEMSRIKKWGNKRISQLISVLTKQKFYDVSCGFRAYSQETLFKMNLIGKFTYTQETFLDLVSKNLRIVEIPMKVRGEREFGESKVANNLLSYAVNSAKIIFRTFRDYKPLKFFGYISMLFFLFSFLIGAFFIGFYIKNGHFSPHLWAGFTSAFLLMFSIVFIITGLLADMFDRIRQTQEKLLYLNRKTTFQEKFGKIKEKETINPELAKK